MSPPAIGTPWVAWKTAWSDWVAASGIAVVWAKQAENPPQLRKPYALLDVLSMQPIGVDERQRVYVAANANGRQLLEHLAGVRRVVLNVQVVTNATGQLADSAWAWADEIQGSLDRSPINAALNAAGLAVTQVSQIRDISAIEQSQFVSRVTFDLTFEGAYFRSDPMGGQWVERAVGDGDVEGNSDPELTFDTEA